MNKLLALYNKNYVVFYKADQREDAIKHRKQNPKLKYARIVEALQGYPSLIEIGKIYPR